jgi:outer membrane biosynthesis protein TonB
VNPTHHHERDEIRARIEASRERSTGLERELQTVDAELEELAVERRQCDLLHEACGAIEKLDEEEAADLFWQDLVPLDAGRRHVLAVRERVDAFQRRVGQIEAGRQTLFAKLAREEETREFLEDDLYELQLEEEARKLEWIVEREPSPLPSRPTVMPWTRGGEDDDRFRKSLALALLLSLLLGVLFPWIPLPVPDRWEVVEVPERFARLLEEKQPEPKPVQELASREEEPSEQVEETPVAAEEVKPEPAATKEEAKPGAGAKGILAFRKQFSPLASSKAADKLGAQARIRRNGEAATGRPTRSLVTAQGAGSSGGIDVASLSRDVGGGGGQGLEGVQVTQATSAIGAIGGGTDRPLSGGPGPSRTDEEIQIVFDRHKAALYRLYNRELRRDPTLQGQMVLRLTIEPDGSVSLCELKSSDMRAPDLAAQVVTRVKTFDFGAKDGIPAITILYPIDFLPAT